MALLPGLGPIDAFGGGFSGSSAASSQAHATGGTINFSGSSTQHMTTLAIAGAALVLVLLLMRRR